MVFISQGNEAERLQAGALVLARGVQHFSHAVNGTRAGVERDLDEISSGEFMLQLQQATGDGNGLELGARLLATFGQNGSADRSIEFYAGRTMIGIALGEVSHSQLNYATPAKTERDYQSACTEALTRSQTAV